MASKDIHSLAEEITELQAKLRKAEFFDHSRELLDCPNCGLIEDVTFEGLLITAYAETPNVDTGMRFVELSSEENNWRCPSCRSVFCALEVK